MIETKKTENHPAVTPQALEFIGKCRLAEAKKEITAENYDRALEIIATIPKDDPLYNQTEMLREDSNQGIYAKAEKLYKEEGKFDEALQKINSLPEGSFRENALANTAKWKQLDSVNMATVKQVQTYLDQGNCGAAIVVTNQIDGSNYWLSQREAMYNKAEECIKNKMDKQIYRTSKIVHNDDLCKDYIPFSIITGEGKNEIIALIEDALTKPR